MQNLFIPRIGGILSADIAVPDFDQMVTFYAKILSTGKSPLWREDLMNNRGIPIIGLGPQSEEYSNLPHQWMPHIQVSNVAKSLKSAINLGGKDLMHDDDDNGQMLWAVILDPNGSAFGIIPVISENDMPAATNTTTSDANIGCIAWTNLTVPNATTMVDFYQKVIGWKVKKIDKQDNNHHFADFEMIGDDGSPVAGISIANDKKHEIPPVWLLYLPVGDLKESIRQVKEGGGSIIKDYTISDKGVYYTGINPIM